MAATLAQLQARIDARFPESGLAQVAADLVHVGRDTRARAEALSKPYFGLRLLTLLVVAGAVGAQIYAASLVDWRDAAGLVGRADALSLSQGVDAAVNLLVLGGAATFFLMSLEQRWKRRRVQRALHELRSFAHVIDMHQLTKDPTLLLSRGPATPAS